MQPIHIAAKNGHRSIVDFLLSKTSRVAVMAQLPMAPSASQPLHLAAYEGHFYTCQALLEAGAVVSAKNRFGDTFLHIAARHDHTDFVVDIIDYFKRKPNVVTQGSGSSEM